MIDTGHYRVYCRLFLEQCYISIEKVPICAVSNAKQQDTWDPNRFVNGDPLRSASCASFATFSSWASTILRRIDRQSKLKARTRRACGRSLPPPWELDRPRPGLSGIVLGKAGHQNGGGSDLPSIVCPCSTRQVQNYSFRSKHAVLLRVGRIARVFSCLGR